MKITKHQPDEESIIHIRNCEGLLTMGLQDDVVTIWAATSPLTDKGLDISYVVKSDGDTITNKDFEGYVTSFINDHLIVHLFKDSVSKSEGAKK